MERNMNENTEILVIDKMGEIAVKQTSFWIRAKNALLETFCLILEETKINEYLACFLMSISFTQVWGIAYDTELFPLDTYTFHSDLEALLNLLSLYKVVKRTESFFFFLIIAYLLFLSQIFYFIMIFLVWYRQHSGKGVWYSTRTCSILTQLNLWILMMPTTEFFVSILRCNNGFSECFSMSYYIHLGIATFLYLFLIMNTIVICLLGNDCAFFCPNNPYCRYPWQFESFYCISRLVLSVSSQFCTGSEANWLVVAEMISISLIMFYFLVYYCPYYNAKVSGCFYFCVVGFCWITFNLFVLKLLSDFDIGYRGHTAVTVFGFIICFHWSIHFKRVKIKKLLRTQCPLRIVSEIDFNLYVMEFIRMIDYKSAFSLSQEEDMDFHGLIALHQTECLNPMCPLDNLRVYYLPLTKQHSEKENFGVLDTVCLKYGFSYLFILYSIYLKFHLTHFILIIYLIYQLLIYSVLFFIYYMLFLIFFILYIKYF